MDSKEIVVRGNVEVKQTRAGPSEVKGRRAEPWEVGKALPYMAWDSRRWAKAGSHRGKTDVGPE